MTEVRHSSYGALRLDALTGNGASRPATSNRVRTLCCREVSEEIGIELVGDVTCILVQHKHDLDREECIVVFFSAALPPGQAPEIRAHSYDALHWAQLSDPPEPTVAYVAYALSAISRPDHTIVEYFGLDGK
jgi:ADP-ribose pyrophosphatase YjhB (NUDIX family)